MISTRTFDNTIIRASAGTGKTFQLSSRFVALMHHGAEPDRILATTFTRKAAGEILNRVLVRLAEATTSDEKLHELATSIGDASLTRDQALKLLALSMKNLHRLRVSTLDAFFSQLAGSFSLELGLPPGWQIVDDLEALSMRDEAIEAVLREGEMSDLLTLMHQLAKGENQRSIAELMRAQVDRLYALFVTTDESAWTTLPRRKALNEAELADTLEELRCLEVPEKAQQKAINESYNLAIVGDWSAFINKGLAKKLIAGETTFSRKAIAPQAIEVFTKLLDHVAAESSMQLIMQTEATYAMLSKYHAQLTKLKRERRAVRFEDVTQQLATLVGARSAVQSESLAYRLDGRIEHLLLDEFQDTSPEQWQAVRPFAKHATVEREDRSFFCVGDQKQAIYGWRGGEAEIFSAIAGELSGVSEEPMVQSYRSSQIVIDTVNQVFQHLTEHPHLEKLEGAIAAWQERFDRHTTHRSDLPGYTTLETAPIAEKGEEKQAILHQTVERIEAIVKESPGMSVGVLVYTNAEIGPVIHELRRRGIAASEEGGGTTTDSAAVQVILSLCRLADHPGDKLAAFHLQHCPIGDALGLNDEENTFASHQLARKTRADLIAHGYGPVVSDWAKQLAPFGDAREVRRLRQVVELAYRFQNRASLRTDDFVCFVEQERVKMPTVADVRVMTIHQSKGLEFDIVVFPIGKSKNFIRTETKFVVERKHATDPASLVCRSTNESVRQMLPRRLQEMFERSQGNEVSEALCTLYVALTRAIHSLRIIVNPSSSSEKKFPRSIAGMVRSTLVGEKKLDGSATYFEHGDANWFGKLERKQNVEKKIGATPQPRTIRLARSSSTRRSLERTSPSMLEGGERVSMKDTFKTEGAVARQRGTLIHALFEQIIWFEDGVPADEHLRTAATRSLFGEAQIVVDINQHIAEFREMLTVDLIQRHLKKTAYSSQLSSLNLKQPSLTVHNEQPIAYRTKNQLLTGFIDRLVLLRDGDEVRAADVIDFKTDMFGDDRATAIKKKAAHYKPQLQAYREAISKQHNLSPDQITTRLLFVTECEEKLVK